MGWNPVTAVKSVAKKATDPNEYKKAWDAALEAAKKIDPSTAGHIALDVVGLVPVVGEAADLANAGWYLAEGNKSMAALSAAAAIPGLGYIAAGTKVGKAAITGVKAAGKTTGVSKTINAVKTSKAAVGVKNVTTAVKNSKAASVVKTVANKTGVTKAVNGYATLNTKMTNGAVKLIDRGTDKFSAGASTVSSALRGTTGAINVPAAGRGASGVPVAVGARTASTGNPASASMGASGGGTAARGAEQRGSAVVSRPSVGEVKPQGMTIPTQRAAPRARPTPDGQPATVGASMTARGGNDAVGSTVTNTASAAPRTASGGGSSGGTTNPPRRTGGTADGPEPNGPNGNTGSNGPNRTEFTQTPDGNTIRKFENGQLVEKIESRADGSTVRWTRDAKTNVETTHYGEIGQNGARVERQRTVKVGNNSVEWKYDENGKLVSASGTLQSRWRSSRSSSERADAAELGRSSATANDQGGHLVDHRFLGRDGEQGVANMFPQNSQFNNSAFRVLGNDYDAVIKQGGTVRFNHTLGEFDAHGRPGTVHVEAEFYDKNGNLLDTVDTVFRNEAGQQYSRRIS